MNFGETKTFAIGCRSVVQSGQLVFDQNTTKNSLTAALHMEVQVFRSTKFKFY